MSIFVTRVRAKVLHMATLHIRHHDLMRDYSYQLYAYTAKRSRWSRRDFGVPGRVRLSLWSRRGTGSRRQSLFVFQDAEAKSTFCEPCTMIS